MASKIEALVRNFLKTDGDALYLVPGEKIFLVKGTNKLVVGRENLGDESFRAVAAELVPGAPVESLSAMRHRTSFRVDEATEPVEIQFARSGNAHAITICRVRPAEPAPALEPEPIPERRPEPPKPAATVRPPGGTSSFSVTGTISTPRPAPEVVPLDVPDSLSSRDFDASALSKLQGGRRRSERPLDEALRRMTEKGASELHVGPGGPPAYHGGSGELVVVEDMPPIPADELDKALTALLTDRARRDLEARGSACFSFDHPETGRTRVRVARERGGLSAHLRRVLAAPPAIEGLALPPAALRVLGFPSGLFVIAGSGSSGKTSTRAALLLQALSERPRSAVVVEDPAEVPVPRGRGLVSTREVGIHAPSLADALKGAVGTGADLYGVPAPSDAESLALLLDLASEGLVLVEVTAGDAGEALERLFELAPETRLGRTRERVAALLRAVLVHHLVPLAAGGRAAVFDLLLNSGAVSSLVRDGRTFQLGSLLHAGRAHGMADANDALAELVRRRAVALPAALAASPDAAALKTTLGAPEPAAASEPPPG